MMTKKFTFIATIILVLALGILGYIFYTNKNSKDDLPYCQKYQKGTESCPPGCEMVPDGGYDPETDLEWWGVKCVPKK